MLLCPTPKRLDEMSVEELQEFKELGAFVELQGKAGFDFLQPPDKGNECPAGTLSPKAPAFDGESHGGRPQIQSRFSVELLETRRKMLQTLPAMQLSPHKMFMIPPRRRLAKPLAALNGR
jgi:hypothetical protein